MKKNILVGLIKGIFLMVPLSATDLREEFKKEFHARQKNLMNKESYYQFLDPFFQEAEQKLVIAQLCFQNKLSAEEVSTYRKALSKYTLKQFLREQLSKKYPRYQDEFLEEKYYKWKKRLLDCIEAIKNAHRLDFDSAREFAQTKAIFQKAGVHYYDQLPFFARKVFDGNLSRYRYFPGKRVW